MSSTGTYNESRTFTVTHAKELGAKVATDLKRIQRFYGSPTDSQINDYETEIVELLRNGLLGTVTYGFKRGENFIEPTLKYTAKDFSSGSGDDDPGKVRPGADISGATFYSFLSYSPAWSLLTTVQKENIEKVIPIKRGTANTPGMDGYLTQDRTYSSGTKSLDRSSLKSY